MLTRWRAMSSRARREAWEGYLSVSPWVIGFLLFSLGPIVASIYFSFTEWSITRPPTWVGLHNYIRMFTKDQLFWQALKVTSYFVVLALPLKLVCGLGLSLLLNLKIPGMNVYRTIF